jgi:hypothetical protein
MHYTTDINKTGVMRLLATLRRDNTSRATRTALGRLIDKVRNQSGKTLSETQVRALAQEVLTNDEKTLKMIPLEMSSLQIISELEKNGTQVTAVDIRLIRKIVFSDIDLDHPNSQYHLHLVRALFQKVERDGVFHRKQKYIYDIADQLGIRFSNVRQIKFDLRTVEDISHNIGSRRDVDCITLVADDGKSFTFTVSLDKKPYRQIGESHSLQEADTLIPLNGSENLWAVQKCYGATKVIIGSGLHGIVFKEFLPGRMVSNFTNIVGSPFENEYRSDLPVVAFSHGRMIGNIFHSTGAFPIDMNPENVIIDDRDVIICRTCDLNGLERDLERGLAFLRIDIRDWGSFAKYFLFGIFTELDNGEIDQTFAIMERNLGNIIDSKSMKQVRQCVQLIRKAKADIAHYRDREDSNSLGMIVSSLLANQMNTDGLA